MVVYYSDQGCRDLYRVWQCEQEADQKRTTAKRSLVYGSLVLVLRHNLELVNC